MKIFLILILSSFFLFASITEINNKILNNKTQINDVKIKKSTLNKNISELGNMINKEEKEYKKVVGILKSTNTKLLLNKIKLADAVKKVNVLNLKASKLEKIKSKMEQDVVDFVIEKYAMSMGVDQLNKRNINDVLNKEVYTLVFDNTKEEILNLNIQYLKINSAIRNNKKKIAKLNEYIKEQDETKKKYVELESMQEKSLLSLNKKHKSYQDSLKRLIKKQNQITDLLGSLNILKKKEIKKEEIRIKKAKKLAQKRARERKEKARKAQKEKQKKLDEAKKRLSAKKYKTYKKTKEIQIKKRDNLDKEIDIEVKKIGSSAKGVKISKYYGSKTIAPLKSYTIMKKFGKYYDSVYKMELFNESVALKTKTPNAKVFSVFKGQVVYAKQNSGLLENVVIVKHSHNLHTIYSHLDQISPTLKAGKWIPKGYVVGRVNDTLEFQATKNSKYIDPLKLIK